MARPGLRPKAISHWFFPDREMFVRRIWFNKTFSSVHSALLLIREADEEGDYRLICTSTNPHAPVFLVADEHAVEPAGLKGEAYLDWCLEFCRHQDIHIFVPGKEASLVSAAADRFAAQGTRVLMAASQEVLHLLHDKAAFYEAVADDPVPPAAFRRFTNLDEFDAAWAALKPDHRKLCVKPSTSVYGLGFSVVDEKRSSAQLLLEGVEYHIGLTDLRRGLEELGSVRSMLLMEYLDGHEYSVDCVADQGRLVCAIQRKKPLLAGRGQIIDDLPVIHGASLRLVERFGLNGFINVQFREGQNGLRLLEINPRMSGGIAMACLAGPNLPWLAIRGFDLGFDGLRVPPIRAGLRVGEMPRALEWA